MGPMEPDLPAPVTAVAALSPGAIDRTSAEPLHFQVAGELERRIVSGTWPPGHQLPPEPDLGRLFGLSRATIRQALSRLEQEGLIVRQKGRGTFVADDRRRSWLLQSAGGFFQDEVERLGRRVTSTVLNLEEGPLPGWASDALELPEGSEGVTVERLRSVDGRVALYVVNHLPQHLAKAIVGMEDPSASLYGRLRELHGIEVFGARRTLEAVAASDRLSTLLGVAPQSPLAFVQSVSWDSSLRVFDCYRAWVRTDRLKVDIEVSASVVHEGQGRRARP